MADYGLSATDKIMQALENIAKGMGGGEVEAGFMAGSKYPDGTPTAAVAFWNEFGGTFTIPAHDVTLYRSIDATGDFAHQGRFVKKSKANFATTHHVEAHQVTRPPRPFFRTMIAENSGDWPKKMAALTKKEGYNGKKVLGTMGQLIKGQIEKSINDLMNPPLAKSTIRRKGFSKPLIETSHMLNSVDYKVST
jgi:hypothetical protein